MWDFNNSFSHYPQTLQRQTVAKVSGKPGAEAYRIAPNSEVLLLDETAPIVWLKTTDSGGYATLTAYDITVHEEERPIDYKSFDERLKKLEEAIYAKPNAVPAQSE